MTTGRITTGIFDFELTTDTFHFKKRFVVTDDGNVLVLDPPAEITE